MGGRTSLLVGRPRWYSLDIDVIRSLQAHHLSPNINNRVELLDLAKQGSWGPRE